jgi:hypothetical protein
MQLLRSIFTWLKRLLSRTADRPGMRSLIGRDYGRGTNRIYVSCAFSDSHDDDYSSVSYQTLSDLSLRPLVTCPSQLPYFLD